MCDRRHQPASSSQYFIVCAFGYESAAHSLLPEVRGGKASVKYFTFELATDLMPVRRGGRAAPTAAWHTNLLL